jgi:hypothetical protein
MGAVSPPLRTYVHACTCIWTRGQDACMRARAPSPPLLATCMHGAARRNAPRPRPARPHSRTSWRARVRACTRSCHGHASSSSNRNSCAGIVKRIDRAERVLFLGMEMDRWHACSVAARPRRAFILFPSSSSVHLTSRGNFRSEEES